MRHTRDDKSLDMDTPLFKASHSTTSIRRNALMIQAKHAHFMFDDRVVFVMVPRTHSVRGTICIRPEKLAVFHDKTFQQNFEHREFWISAELNLASKVCKTMYPPPPPTHTHQA